MSIRKKLLRSHLMMVAIPFCLLLVIGVFCLRAVNAILFEKVTGTDAIQEEFFDVQEQMYAMDFDALLGSATMQEQLAEKISEHGFKTSIWLDGAVVYTDMNEKEQAYLKDLLFGEEKSGPGHDLWVSNLDVRMVASTRQTKSGLVYVVAASVGEMALLRGVEPGALIGLGILFVLAACTLVGVVLAVSLRLSDRMTRDLTVSLDALSEGARRIRGGNFDVEVEVGTDEELSQVCASFNEMQRKLKENIEKNERYERDRRQMLAGISHDLRTPLTSIKSYVKGILDGVASSGEREREYLSVVYRKSCDMEGLIEQLFFFSKLEAGDLPFHKKSVRLIHFLATVLDGLACDVAAAGGMLNFSPCEEEMIVQMDSLQMKRVLTNIITNTIKYGRAADGTLVDDVSVVREGTFARIRIADHGSGLAQEQLSRIFDSFYRADEARSNPERGSGLGLAIARQIVTAHGGMIEAKTEDGLAFYIELPCMTEEMTR